MRDLAWVLQRVFGRQNRRDPQLGRNVRPPARLRIRAWLCDADGTRPAILERSGWLTPYSAESIAEDSLRAGPGARLEVRLPLDCDDATVGVVNRQFAWLINRQIAVSVTRSRSWAAA